MRLTRLLGYEFRYWKRYVEREVYKNTARVTYKPIAGWKIIGKPKNIYYDEQFPWTDEFQKNLYKKPIHIPEIKEWTLLKGDRVEILVGKDKGKRGIINSIIKQRNWVYVEGLNTEPVEQKGQNGKPFFMQEEKPLIAGKQVKLVDPSDEKPCDVEWRYTEDGKRIRLSTRTGRVIPQPIESQMWEDYVHPGSYKHGEKDTPDDVVKDISYVPKLLSFEEDIMQSKGITETRKPGKTYWY